MTNCAISQSSLFIPTDEMPWNLERAVHLFRRMSFGANIDTILQALSMEPQQVIDDLINEAIQLPLSDEPKFANKTKSDYGLPLLQSTLEKDGFAREWIIDLQKNGLRGRMAFFWHNHFVTRFNVYESSSYTYQYHKLLQEYALGNFKEFVRKIGLTPAMLIFLNGDQNLNTSPNENYAREVYELFTLGVDNGYSQEDIVETARAFTGYNEIPEEWGPIFFNPDTFDNGQKTIFNQTGNWGYDDVINILFEQRPIEISEFITGKIYAHFVNPTPDEIVISQVAEVFRNANWELAPLLKAMFKSIHFFDEKNISTIIPGHIEHILMFFNELDIDINGLSVLGIYADANENSQSVFNPVDVGGWPGNRSWINTTSIAYRWDYVESQLGLHLVFGFGALGEFARKITKEDQDVEVVVRDLIHYFLPKGLQFEADYNEAIAHFKGEIPENYFVDGTWTMNYWALPIQFYGLLKFMNRLPEYQLK